MSNIDGSLMLSTKGSGTATIICDDSVSLEFKNITQLQISGLEFIRCGSKVELVHQFILEDSKFHGANDDSALHLNHTNTSVIQCSFVSNTAGTYQNVQVSADLRYTFPYVRPIIQSNSSRTGGALIVTSSTVNISSSHFQSNTAIIGGAIFSQLGSNMAISNCTFINNSATGCSTSDNRGHGGALFIGSDCTITAHNCTFMNNTAGFSGGAIALFKGIFLDSIHNVFISNRAGGYGGVISAYNRSRITIDNSCFSNNTGRYGGVISTHGYSSITVGNSSFDNNEASVDGGVMYAGYSSSVNVGNSSFDNNEASNDGGVIHAYNRSSITVNNSSFDNNEASNDGGVLCTYSGSSITVGNSFFNNNEASNDGGVMYAYYRSSITVGNSSFDNNEASVDGGVMYAGYSSSVTVGDSSFDNNEANNDGGVMCAYDSSSITVGNSFFDYNKASIEGGVMYAYSSSSITVGNSSFDNNEAGYGGVVYAYDSSNITVGNSFFDYNKASNGGGVMYAYSSSSITVGNSSFDNNEANYGGVMCAYDSSNITVGNSFFDYNKASNGGGVMYAYSSSNITVGNSFFDYNKASVDGGVMYVYDSSSISVGNSIFDNNEAGYGGVMCASSSSSITVGNSFFDYNKASVDGGVMCAYDSSNITVGNSSFENNEAGYGGVMCASSSCSITVGNGFFDYNKASVDGGVMCAYDSSNITVGNSSFDNNEAGHDGGVMYVYSSTIFKSKCTFFNNSALEGGVIYILIGSFKDIGNTYFSNVANNGGVFTLVGSDMDIIVSSFVNNTAESIGGVLYALNFVHKYHNIISLTESTFHRNQATNGGVVALLANDNLTVTESTFLYNNAIRGGAIYLLIGNKLTVKYCNFSHNSANSDGGVIYSADQNILLVGSSTLNFNRADNNGGVLCSLFQTELTITGDNCTFIGNQGHRGGVVYASDCTIIVHGQILLMVNNTALDAGGALHLSSANVTFLNEHNTVVGNVAKSGGAIFVTESQFVLSNGILVGNQADYGGAIYASESKLVVEVSSWTKFNVSTNLAIHHGGGLYTTVSELKGYNLYITKNRANSKGGGIHAVNSSIIIEGAIHFTNNEAENGGAISLERTAKLKGKSDKNNSVFLISNRANHHGGALYVDDKTNPEMCAAITTRNEAVSSKTECFSQSVFISFLDNSADISGSNLFGGLLDRCTAHSKSHQKSESNKLGLASFKNSSNLNKSNLDTVTSHPVQLCFCRDNQLDCNYQPKSIQVNRGKIFSVKLIAYDQVHHAVNASIQCSLNSSAGGLGEGQQIQTINKPCTELKYNLFTPNNYEELTFSAVRGPCNNISGISERSVMIEITCSCPIGFQISNYNETSCDCVCNRVLQSYEKTECNPATESIIRRENFWISYINHTWPNSSGYVIYPHCPFDYCYTPEKEVSINLNLPHASDTQCDLNRTGILCGACKPGFSVSLGSSKCILCNSTTLWPGLLVTTVIVFVISGTVLVVFLLSLNLTVAIGTLNGIIFYANIAAANKSALFPSGVSFASVVISWLNFDFGLDVCFFDGMDTYIKTWLTLAFPAYIIILVVVIIESSYYFGSFGRLIGKKDPVATLATLILLSYAKLLQTVFTAFSSATLDYPDGSKKSFWAPDATIECFNSKHTGLFFTAILILLVGLVYTLLLFSWQWFFCCPRKRLNWIRNQKLSSFMEIYHVPYTPRHRYWTGLLLLVRVSVYLVSAFNPSGDPRVTLSATIFIMSSLVLYIATFGIKMYKNHFINTMETLTYFNSIALYIFTWYTIDADTNQAAITNISVGITFIQLTVVLIYHACKHMNQKLFAMIQESAISIKTKKKLLLHKQKRVSHKPVPADEDIHRFHELLDMIDRPANTNDYNIPQVKPKPAKPTQSVVEPPKPLLVPATPLPLEAIKEELELESEQQASKHDGTDVITVKENPSRESKKCIKNYSGIENADSECDDSSTDCETEMKHGTILKENSNPIPHFDSHYSDIEQAREETMDMSQSDNMDQSSQKVLPFPAASDEQEGVGSHCIIIEADIYHY